MKTKYQKQIQSLELFKQPENKYIREAKDVYDLAKDYRKLDKEVFCVYLLNTKNKVIAREIIAIGILDATIIHPREVFRLAILHNASRIVLSHNHPSGNTQPSEEDREITKKLESVGDIIGIEVLDHVIVGDDYYSFLTE